MASVSLTTRDINVLEKIRDPESEPSDAILIDDALPQDPHITDKLLYEQVVAREKAIVQNVLKTETELSTGRSVDSTETALAAYRQCLEALSHLISQHPDYASARNNRAQVLRRLYGDAMLLDVTVAMPMPLIEQPGRSERTIAARVFLQDLQQSILLLTPSSPSSPVSPQAARTLSKAYTQRAAVYLKTSRLLAHRRIDIDATLDEARWLSHDFEEAASHDLARGGRYGNEIAKGLAVSVNPTAKLCGEMVREAMKKEYGEAFAQ